MKIGFIRYPDVLYKTGRVIKGGSEVANQQIIDSLRSLGEEVIEFSPQSKNRIDLIDIPAVGTPLMFQDLYKQIEEINSCDLIVSTNWFGLIMPEIKVPRLVVFHSNAKWLNKSLLPKDSSEGERIDYWLFEGKSYGLGLKTKQDIHEEIISIEEKYFCDKADHIIAVSEALMNNIIDDYGVDKERISAINNPYDGDWENILFEKNYSGDLKIATLSRLPADESGFIWKAADRMLEVFPKLKDFNCTLVLAVGKSNYKQMFKKHIPNAKIIENADRQKVAEILKDTHIALLLSRWEACQMTLIESMIMGVVPITFGVGVAPEIIKNGENGFLIDSIGQVFEIIDRLKNDRQLLERMSKQARETALEKFNTNLIGRQYKLLFERIVDKN